MKIFINSCLTTIQHVAPPTSQKSSVFSSGTDVLWFILLILIFVVFFVGMISSILIMQRRLTVMAGINGPQSRKTLTPTQKFILAASSPTMGSNYKCVIDIWETRASEREVETAKTLFEWGWGEFTYENAINMAEECLNSGYNKKYKEYCCADMPSAEISSQYSDLQIKLLEQMKQQYPKQGMLAWDLVRVLSIVGGAYMGGIMEYEEAVKIAFKACKLLQENFSSWDDMVSNYTLGYQFWRNERKTDRLKYYKRLKRRSWIYKISWNTTLREEEL